jgi:hypothetical protein
VHITLSFCLALSAASLSVGESGALLVGMRDATAPAPWMTARNVAYAISDMGLGLGLGAAELAGKGDGWYAYAALGALALSCGSRAVEYRAGAPRPFCENAPLFAVDLVKLALAAGALAASLAGKRAP